MMREDGRYASHLVPSIDVRNKHGVIKGTVVD